MRKPVIIGIITVVILGIGGFVIRDRNSGEKTNMEPGEKQEQKTQQLGKPLESQEVLYVEINYVERETPSMVNPYGFTYKATLKNILVTPFITNFGVFECNFKDGDGNKYSGTIFDNNTFEKAILPNESREFTAKDLNVNISGLQNTIEGLRKCSYNEKGENNCRTINDLQIIDCMGYISTDGKNAGGNDGGNGGQFPTKVTFPTL